MNRPLGVVRRFFVTIFLASLTSLSAILFMLGPRASAWIPHNLSAAQVRLAQFPKIILWAWERPADLHYINPSEVGVDFLAETVHVGGDKVVIRPRLQPLKVPPGTFLIATVRIETNQTTRPPGPPVFSAAQRAQTVSAIARLGRMPSVQAVQIDFDATVSERAFYRDLLNDMRRELPDSAALSITALASWCEGDNWLGGLPIDEAVPMLFRMGPDRREILGELRDGHKFAAAICNQSIGISTDEPLSVRLDGQRVYIFRPDIWSQESVRAAVGGVTK